MGRSVWRETVAREVQSPMMLRDDINTDVLVVGGGICGILTAYMLKKAGVRCIVAEAKNIGGGITQNTTAKVTAQHGFIYADLIKRFGAEKAEKYYEANARAVRQYRALSEKFPCDWEDKVSYVYAVNSKRKAEREANACRMLGINARFHEALPLPFKVRSAVSIEKQAQFHPLKLLYALANELEIYENTFIKRISRHTAYSIGGQRIKAKYIVLATHYPLVNIPGLYFMKLYQHRSYTIALEGASLPDGMYVDYKEGGLSFRTYGDLLFVGGGDHKTGKEGGGYAEIRDFAEQAYPNASEKYHWATQDCMTLDNVPYIGRHRRGAGNIFVATGFNKWGMTGAMVAAELLTDLIVSGKSEWADVFSPQRSMMTWQLAANIGSSVKGLLSFGGPRCTHMGCKLHPNIAEQSWDCACHGSRFHKNGHIIDNPAKRGIRL